MEQVHCQNVIVCARILPPHRESLLSAIVYQLHKFPVGNAQHELAVTSLKDRFLLNHPAANITEEQQIEQLANLLQRRIDVYEELGPVFIYQKTNSCRGTVRLVRRSHRRTPRFAASTHYDAFLHRIKPLHPQRSSSSTNPSSLNTAEPSNLSSNTPATFETNPYPPSMEPAVLHPTIADRPGQWYDNIRCDGITIPVRRMAPDGHCLFFVTQLYQHDIEAPAHLTAVHELRREVVTHLYEHLDSYWLSLLDTTNSLDLPEEDQSDRVFEFLSLLRDNCEWGGEETLLAVTRLYNCNIIVYNEESTHHELPAPAQSARTLHLAYRRTNTL